MKRLLTLATLVALMAAIMPNLAFAGATVVGQLQGVGQIEGPATNQQQLAPQARVWIDEASMGLGGNWGEYTKGTLLNFLRDNAFASGRINVLLANGQTGQAVTHRCIITGSVEVGEETRAGLIFLPKIGALGGKAKLVAKTIITMTVYNLATGQVEAMVKAEGRADKSLATGTAIIIGRAGVGQATARENPEAELVNKALAQAAISLVQQMPACSIVMPAIVPAPIIPTSAPNRPRGRLTKGSPDRC